MKHLEHIIKQLMRAATVSRSRRFLQIGVLRKLKKTLDKS